MTPKSFTMTGVHDPDLTEHIQAFEAYLRTVASEGLSNDDYAALRRLYDELVAMLKDRAG